MSQTEVALMETEQNKYDIFDSDILDREDFVQTLLDISVSRSKAKDNVTFAVDGAWGTGKSFVLDLFEKKAKTVYNSDTNDERFLILHYNCWKYDYYEEPLVALIAAITDQIEEKVLLFDEEKREALKTVITSWTKGTGKIVSEIVKNKTGIDLSSILAEFKAGVEDTRQRVENAHAYDELYTVGNMITELRSQIAAISEDKTILLVVDELDRCMPDYAIKVLERLHHLTEGMENTVIILCYDKEKIKCFVKTVFGIEDNANYLNKFVRFELALGIGHLQKGNRKFQDYYNLFPNNVLGIPEDIDTYLAELFQGIDIREQEQLIGIARLCHTVLTEEKMDVLTLYTELLMVIAMYKCGDKSLDGDFSYKADFENTIKEHPRNLEWSSEAGRINLVFSKKTAECYQNGPFYHESDPQYVITKVNAYSAVILCWFWIHENRTGNIQTNLGQCQNQITQQIINEQRVFLRKYWDMLKHINK